MTLPTATAPLGLIAAGGGLPLALARAARERGRPVAAVAFPGHTDPRLEAECASVTWCGPGELGLLVDALRAAGAAEAVLAGALPKALLYEEAAAARLDRSARELLAGLADRRDQSILAALADHLAQRGVRLLPQAELAPELAPGPGPLGAVAPTPAQQADVAFALPIARALAGLDVGQTVVVKDGAVLAVEALEGTDAAIRRAGGFAPGACVVKVARPRQDPRFDVPTIGTGTLEAVVEAKASAVAFEAGRTLVLDRADLVSRADAAGVAVFGVAP